MSRIVVVITMLLLAACSHLPTSDRYWVHSDVVPAGAAASLLHYAAYVRGLSATEHEKELERQRAAFSRDKSDFRRLQYALALGSPSATVSEQQRALLLIDPLLNEGKGHDADLVALAGLYAVSLKSQRRGDELEKKLNAVKDIERNLMQRERGK